MSDPAPTFVKDGRAFLRGADGTIYKTDPKAAEAKIAEGDRFAITENEYREHQAQKAANTTGGRIKTFAESAAAGAIDTAQAPLAAPIRLGAAALGMGDPLANISGRSTVENIASLYGSARSQLAEHDLAPGESGGRTGEAYGREYGENARARAEANPGTTTAGQFAGAMLAGGALSGGTSSLGSGLATKLGGGLGARAAGAFARGALEGAAYGDAGASEEAYIHNMPLTGEKLIASMGLGAILGGTVSLGAEGLGALVRRGSRGATPIDSPRLADGELHPPVAAEAPFDPLPTGTSFDNAASAANDIAKSSGASKELDTFLNQSRRSVSEAERSGQANQTSSAVNEFLRDAQQSGATYDGLVYRGTSEAELEAIRKTGQATHTLSVSKDIEGAQSFLDRANKKAAAGDKPGVLLEIKNHPVPVDGIDGSNTFSEALIPKGEAARIVGERVENGQRIVTLEMGPKATTAAEALPGAAVAAEAAPSGFSQSLRNFADERTAKSLGARGSDLKKLGRTAEKAEAEMHAMSRTVRDMKLEDGTPVFRAMQSQEELAERVLQAKNETGARLGAFREKADQVFAKHPEIAPNTNAIASQIRRELVEPLASHPYSAVQSQAAPIEQLARDLDMLGARANGGSLAANDVGHVRVSDLTRMRQGLDDQIYQAKRGVNLTQQGAPPNLKDLEKARGMLEGAIEASTDKAAQYFDTAGAQSYKQIKTQWRQLNLASDIAGAAQLQNLGNRVVSPTDYIAGAGAMASGAGGIQAAMTALGHKAIREHASSVLAVLADRLANTLDGKIDSGLGTFFRESTQRASASVAGAGRVAAAVPLRRTLTPLAVEAFMGRSKSLEAAYEKRTAELVAAAREGGAGVRGAMVSAMGPGYDATPKLTQAATVAATRGAQYLASQMPSGIKAPTVFNPSRTLPPSDMEMRDFANKWAAVANPLSVLDDLRRGTVTHSQVNAIKTVYPELYQEVRVKTLERIRELDEQGKRMPFDDRLQLDLFLDLDGAGEPTLAGKFVDRVSGMLAAQQAQKPKPGAGNQAALAKLSASAKPASDSVLGG